MRWWCPILEHRRARCVTLVRVRRWAVLWAAAWLAAAPARAQDEVPFVTSPHPVTVAMLELARVQPDDLVLDLGSGDGRIVIAAASRFGARGLGVELSPALVERSRENAARAGVGGRAQFRVQDLFETDLSVASVITMYLLPEVNLQLRPKLLALQPGTRIVSHDWDMGAWEPDRSIVVDAPDKPVGLDRTSRVHLWVVPARLAGLWCAGDLALRLEQTFQAVHGRWTQGGARGALQARIDGRTVPLRDGADAHARLTLGDDGALNVDSVSGAWAAWRGLTLLRTEQADCR